jgi:hypothetical protein
MTKSDAGHESLNRSSRETLEATGQWVDPRIIYEKENNHINWLKEVFIDFRKNEYNDKLLKEITSRLICVYALSIPPERTQNLVLTVVEKLPFPGQSS